VGSDSDSDDLSCPQAKGDFVLMDELCIVSIIPHAPLAPPPQTHLCRILDRADANDYLARCARYMERQALTRKAKRRNAAAR